MGIRHWTEEDFLHRMYGIGGGDESHLESCTECGEQLKRWEQRRSAVTAEPEVSHEFLAAQRRAIYGRLTEPRSTWGFRWASAMAATLMVALGLFFFRPGQAPQPPAVHTDDSVFAEVYSIEQSAER